MKSARRAARDASLARWRALMDPTATFATVMVETVAQALRREADKPMRGGSADLAHGSLFSDSHLQQELFK